MRMAPANGRRGTSRLNAFTTVGIQSSHDFKLTLDAYTGCLPGYTGCKRLVYTRRRRPGYTGRRRLGYTGRRRLDWPFSSIRHCDSSPTKIPHSPTSPLKPSSHMFLFLCV
eukprot:356701-Chlamydomonas_euryale.AAC.12